MSRAQPPTSWILEDEPEPSKPMVLSDEKLIDHKGRTIRRIVKTTGIETIVLSEPKKEARLPPPKPSPSIKPMPKLSAKDKHYWKSTQPLNKEDFVAPFSAVQYLHLQPENSYVRLYVAILSVNSGWPNSYNARDAYEEDLTVIMHRRDDSPIKIPGKYLLIGQMRGNRKRGDQEYAPVLHVTYGTAGSHLAPVFVCVFLEEDFNVEQHKRVLDLTWKKGTTMAKLFNTWAPQDI